jgi:hypothetical protein
VEQLKQLKTDMIERVLHHEKFVLSSFTPSVDRLVISLLLLRVYELIDAPFRDVGASTTEIHLASASVP